MVRVVGLMSSAAWGQGRSSADRQYTYINGRPCTLPTVSCHDASRADMQVMRAVNDVYKGFNTNQVPLAILDLQIPAESVDINVSPDKRTILVHSEANLIEALKVSCCERRCERRVLTVAARARGVLSANKIVVRGWRSVEDRQGGPEGCGLRGRG